MNTCIVCLIEFAAYENKQKTKNKTINEREKKTEKTMRVICEAVNSGPKPSIDHVTCGHTPATRSSTPSALKSHWTRRPLSVPWNAILSSPPH